MHTPLIFDGRNLFDPETMREFGFTYHAVGRPNGEVALQPVVPRKRPPARRAFSFPTARLRPLTLPSMPANPRQSCLRALLEWEKGKHFSDEILHTSLEKEPLVAARPRVFHGDVFRRAAQSEPARFPHRPAARRATSIPKPAPSCGSGSTRSFHMRTAAHAAVNETVELAGRARGLVNAILRRALARKGRARSRARRSRPGRCDCRIPNFSSRAGKATFGAEATRQLCAWNNEPAEVHVRANELRITAAELLRSSAGRRAFARASARDQGPASAACVDRRRSLLRAGSEHAPGLRSPRAAARRDRARRLRRARRQDDLSRATHAQRRPHRRLRPLRVPRRAPARKHRAPRRDHRPSASSTTACRPARRSSPRASTASSSMRRAATPASCAAASMCAGG